MSFRRVERSEIDDTRVTVSLFRASDGSLYGRVETLAFNEAGAIERMTTELDIRDALAMASRIADFKGQDVDVYDPENLWEDDFDRLS